MTLVAATVTASLALTACGGAGSLGGGGDTNTLNVLAINPAQMADLQKLTDENFTKETGIKVNYTLLPENDLRAKLNQDFSSQAGQYDVASISAFEIPNYSKNGWLAPLDDYVKATPEFDQGDVLPTVKSALTGPDGKLYAEPFLGEGSFTMYRKDLFDKAGLTMPENPTWDQVADLAAKIDGTDGAKGICLRGLAGWGQNLAVLNTIVNTFGGQWYDMDWNATLADPAFEQATQFYVDLLREHGEVGAAQAGVLECLNDFQQGKSAIFYDATSVASRLEAADSPIKGKIGYAAAPHKLTENAGWLWTWAWGIQQASQKKDAAWKFISWASSKEYEQLVGTTLGWEKIPAGKRASTYSIPQYMEAAAAFAPHEYRAVTNSADPKNPGIAPRPYVGVQYVGIPQFPDLGQQVAEQVSSAIVGSTSVKDALANSQKIAQTGGDEQN
ncbi:sugar ABC transporter substrate-binding protein [Rhodococcus opacus]|nr:sugar ABC transporter substrate-binding protein [Rhodococcus opacus]